MLSQQTLGDWRMDIGALEDRPIVADPYRPGRALAVARAGMVATAHPLATLAGLDALRAGGSAMDAAVSAAAVLGVTEPAMTGPGGDVFLLYYEAATRRVHGLNGSGRSPRGLAFDDLATLGDAIDPYSWSAVTVPGAVDAWWTAHGRFGRRPWRELLAPAIACASDGYPVSEVVAGCWRDHSAVVQSNTCARRVFLPAGRPPVLGEIFRNPNLGCTLETLADGGRDAFYQGPIADEIVRYSRSTGGFLSADDLAGHRSEWVEPMHTDFRGFRVHQIPPNGQGLAVLLMLNILEGCAIEELPLNGADYLHLLIEAKKLAYADAHRYVCDPEHGSMPLSELLSARHAERQRERIDAQHAAPAVESRLHSGGDTTLLVAADGDGNAVSFINSVFSPFGSGIVAGDSGVLLQNRGCGFSLDASHPNAYAPGKRPFHTIIPGMVTRGGDLYMTYGLMGGPMQPQGHVQLLLAHLCHHLSLQAVVDMPRWQHMQGSEVWLEEGTPPSVARALEGLGHAIGYADQRPFGGAQAILRDAATGSYLGASDPRKDGMALGY